MAPAFMLMNSRWSSASLQSLCEVPQLYPTQCDQNEPLSFPDLYLIFLNLVIGATIQSITYNTNLGIDIDFLASPFFFFLNHPHPYIFSSHSMSPFNSIYKIFIKSFLPIICSLPCLHLCQPLSFFGLKCNERIS